MLLLQETQAETMETIRTIETDSHKNMSLIEIQKVSTTAIAYEGHLKTNNFINLLKYL